MACSPIGQNDRRINQFQKIHLLDDIANQLAYTCVQHGNVDFMDYVDLNCGAVPEGEFNDVVDPASPHQFLAMYTRIAENRFAFAVTGLIKTNQAYREALKDTMFNAGKDLRAAKVSDAQSAFELMNSYVLDGMPCDETKQITKEDAESVEWEKLEDTHEASWNKAGGQLEVYYELQQSFVNGLLSESGYKLEIENMKSFRLSK